MSLKRIKKEKQSRRSTTKRSKKRACHEGSFVRVQRYPCIFKKLQRYKHVRGMDEPPVSPTSLDVTTGSCGVFTKYTNNKYDQAKAAASGHATKISIYTGTMISVATMHFVRVYSMIVVVQCRLTRAERLLYNIMR